jgi:hypothetical protein
MAEEQNVNMGPDQELAPPSGYPIDMELVASFENRSNLLK